MTQISKHFAFKGKITNYLFLMITEQKINRDNICL